MKKIILMVFTLLMLVGCSTKGYSNISNGDDVIFKGPDSSYTKADLFKQLKVASEASIENDILNKIAKNLNIDLSEVEKEADEMIETYKSMGYEQTIIAYYGSIESFKQLFIYSGVLTKLSESYIEDNFAKLVEDDKPVKMQMASFENKETAEKFCSDIKDEGHTFEAAAADNGYNQECQIAVYLDSDNLPINVKSYLNTTADTGLSSLIVSTTTSQDADGNINNKDTYYVLNIASRNIDEFADEYKEKKLSSLNEEIVKNYMFNNHEIKFYDQDIYEIMKAQYEVFK